MSASNAVPPNLLVVEDDPCAAILITETLSAIGVRPEHVSTCREAYRALQRREYACVVIDLGLPDGSGREIQQTIQRGSDPPPVVFVTADDRVENAIAVLQAGALEYVIKRPEYLEQLQSAVLKIVHRGEEIRSRAEVRAAPRPRDSSRDLIIGESKAMREVRARIRRCSDRDVPVLITGETGTGKELVARAIHETGSRSDEPFVAINCAAITGSLFESELFGSIRGAFTGAVRDRRGLFGAAGQGTIFLDEIGELPFEAQAKLLRVLEDRSYRAVGDTREIRSDARVIVATNRNLSEDVEQGIFREDLFYRLDVMSIAIAPLRDRPLDLSPLVEHFLRAEANGFGVRRATPAALDQLRVHAWPGNVRELRHAITRTLLFSDEVEIEQFEIRSSGNAPALPRNRRRLTWNEVAEALRPHSGRLQPTADALEVSVRTLQRRMRDLGMSGRDFR